MAFLQRVVDRAVGKGWPIMSGLSESKNPSSSIQPLFSESLRCGVMRPAAETAAQGKEAFSIHIADSPGGSTVPRSLLDGEIGVESLRHSKCPGGDASRPVAVSINGVLGDQVGQCPAPVLIERSGDEFLGEIKDQFEKRAGRPGDHAEPSFVWLTPESTQHFVLKRNASSSGGKPDMQIELPGKLKSLAVPSDLVEKASAV